MKMDRSSNPREPALDFVKAVAIVMIVVTHSAFTPQMRSDYFFPLYINTAVPLFMIVTGYVNYASAQTRGSFTLTGWFAWGRLWGKLSRLALPYAITLAVEFLYLAQKGNLPGGAFPLLKYILAGGGGPGSYYMPIMFQMLLLLPAVLLLYVRSR
ncbi:MAG: hypothetical protein LBD12_03245, partial [Clostridiales Family XIII bacterium]|nr:hypothetical protein [Clostridiales Family XIII bacterium]